jgi:3-deoxy-manno-octulosonate cytidylyltransferase (CMP-KDO synthetase)
MILNKSDIGTLASEIKDSKMLINENIVKVTTKEKLNNNNFPIALNFVRKDLSKTYQNIYHHIGMYAYKVKVLEKIVNLKQTKNEIKNRLEQLRALDYGIIINVALAKSSSIGVDTREDYLAIKKIMEYKP